MAGPSIDVNATLQCPHGGTVRIAPGVQTATAGGAAVATQSDTTSVLGCPFQKPAPSGTIPSPCVRVQWVVGDLRVKAGNIPSLSRSAIGICFSAESLPQGTVVVAATQTRGQSQ
jgi:hypothetical protein